MLRDEVADHYRSKGYTIRERVRVRGRSGTVHAIDMVAQGPLGNLVVAFEDEGGFEAPELSTVRRSARDIGATPVVALRRIPEGLRRKAAEAGVVMLDEEAMQAKPDAPPAATEPDQAPWPDPEGRRPSAEGDDAAPRREKSTDPGFWKYPRPAAVQTQHPVAPANPFAWLPQEPASARPMHAPSLAGGVTARMPSVPVPSTRQPRPGAPAPLDGPAWWRWVVSAVIFGGAAGGAFYALLRILG